MKVIVHSRRDALISELVNQKGHVVIAKTSKPRLLQDSVLKFKPHIVFFDSGDEIESTIISLGRVLRKIRYIPISGKASIVTKTVIDELNRESPHPCWTTEHPEQRIVMIDPEYGKYSCDGKLKQERTSDKQAEAEMLRFKALLLTARKNHTAALKYSKALAAMDDFEWPEITYRIVHGSFKGAAYAREQMAKYLGVLCHYLPNIELAALPSPVDEPALLRYLHHKTPIETEYVAVCLTGFGINPQIMEAIYRSVEWSYEGSEPDILTGTSLYISGLSYTLRQISSAHQTVVDWLLNLKPDNILVGKNRAHSRAIQTFADFWGVRAVVTRRDLLESALESIANQPNQLIPIELQIPSFSEFYHAAQHIGSDE